MLTDFSKQNSLINHFVGEMRDVKVQKDRLRFRRNMERLGEIMAYEISKTLDYEPTEVETPLGIANCPYQKDHIVLATILRAGLPFHQGLLNFFDHADNAFVSAYRKHHKDGSFDIKMEYVTCPNLDDSVLIIADPMLATGASMAISIDGLLQFGKPKAIHVVSIISSRYGVDLIARKYPNVHLWVCAVDEELTAKSYIVPGLGDAGDLGYGSKIQE